MDKILENGLKNERSRQEENIELIASENYVSKDKTSLCKGLFLRAWTGKQKIKTAKKSVLFYTLEM